MPFNYLLDWSLFERSSIDLKDAVIIFDQAHNIDSLCQQGSDVRLTFDFLLQVTTQLKILIKAQNGRVLHAQYKQKYEDKQEVVNFKVQIQLLMNKMKSIPDSEIIQRQ